MHQISWNKENLVFGKIPKLEINESKDQMEYFSVIQIGKDQFE